MHTADTASVSVFKWILLYWIDKWQCSEWSLKKERKPLPNFFHTVRGFGYVAFELMHYRFCGLQNEFSTNWLSWCTRFYMAMLHVTSVHWLMSTTCLVNEHSVLIMPTTFDTMHRSNCQQLAAEPLWLQLHTSGIQLPTDIIAASSLSTFCRLLKRFLFKQSYPDIIYWHHPASGPCSGCTTLATLKICWLTDWLIDSAGVMFITDFS